MKAKALNILYLVLIFTLTSSCDKESIVIPLTGLELSAMTSLIEIGSNHSLE